MSVQVIVRDGVPEYAVLAWDEYQALLRAANAGRTSSASADPSGSPDLPSLAQLQALREQQGLSQEQLARAVGISPAYLAMIERAERQPDTAIRRSLAQALEQPGWSETP